MFYKIYNIFRSITSNSDVFRVVGNFYVPNASIWPFLMSVSLLGLVLSAVLFFHYYAYGLHSLVFFLFCSLLIAVFWWIDLIKETQNVKFYTVLIQKNLKLGMILFIVSEVFFFFSFFWAFFHSSLSPSIFIGSVWPPEHFFELNKVVNPWSIPILNTLFLLVSGMFVSWSHHLLKISYTNKWQCFFGLFCCLLCAFCFTGWQFYEYYYEELLISDGIYGSCFFLLTGFHGLHVIGGTVFLLVCTVRLLLNHFADGVHVGFDCAVWYWHFVDVIWILLFIFVYVWGNTPYTAYLY